MPRKLETELTPEPADNDDSRHSGKMAESRICKECVVSLVQQAHDGSLLISDQDRSTILRLADEIVDRAEE